MIEESGENWGYYTSVEPPHSIQVTVRRYESVEQFTSIEKPRKHKKSKKPPPFGFARALDVKGAKRGRKT